MPLEVLRIFVGMCNSVLYLTVYFFSGEVLKNTNQNTHIDLLLGFLGKLECKACIDLFWVCNLIDLFLGWLLGFRALLGPNKPCR